MKNIVFAFVLCLSVSPLFAADPLVLHFINVGQGDSIFIQSPDGKTMLVDGGEMNWMAENYLKSIGVKQIDIVVGTHPHLDHLGGLVGIVKRFEVGQVVMPRVESVTTVTYQQILETAKAKGMKITTGKAGLFLDLGPSVVAECLAPNSDKYADVNDTSVVIKVSFGDASFLLTGDATTVSEQEMLKICPEKLRSTVLKVPHHGSTSSSSEAFIKAVDAKIGIISCGKGNDYGHPTKTVWQRVSGAHLFRTDEQGTIILSTDGRKFAAFSPPVNGQYHALAAFQTPDMVPQVAAAVPSNIEPAAPKVAAATPTVAPDGNTVVYVTKNGAKYHRANCRALSGTLTTLTRAEAESKNYGPCGSCKP